MDRRTICILVCVSALSFVATGVALHLIGDPSAASSRRFGAGPHPRRVVVLSPGVAEWVSMLGAADLVVGVADHTDAPGLQAKARVGSFLNPSMEKIVSLDPDLVILRADQPHTATRLVDGGIPVLRLPDSTVAEVVESIPRLGAAIGKRREADRLVYEVRRKLREIRERVDGLDSPRVLLIIGRADSTLRSVYGASPESFPGDLLRLAGARNVLGSSAARYPVISKETIMTADPEVIIEITAPPSTVRPERARSSWEALSGVTAVSRGRVHVIASDELLVPGPRAIAGVADLACLLHPELRAERGDALCAENGPEAGR